MRCFYENGQPKRKLMLRNYKKFPSYVQEFIEIKNHPQFLDTKNNSEQSETKLFTF